VASDVERLIKSVHVGAAQVTSHVAQGTPLVPINRESAFRPIGPSIGRSAVGPERSQPGRLRHREAPWCGRFGW